MLQCHNLPTYLPTSLSREMGFDPGVFGRFDLAALVQPYPFSFLFVCLLYNGNLQRLFGR